MSDFTKYEARAYREVKDRKAKTQGMVPNAKCEACGVDCVRLPDDNFPQCEDCDLEAAMNAAAWEEHNE